MTKREMEQRHHMLNALQSIGFTFDEAQQLRRISMCLRSWHELECGTGEGQVTRSVERENDDGTGRPFMRVQYPTAHGYHDSRYPIRDRETGAKKRLDKIIAARNERATPPACALSYGTDPNAEARKVSAYIQGDPRGAALYILRAGDVPEGKDAGAYYTRGICVY